MEDRKTQSLALSYLSDPIPPVRAQGLHLLTDLIRTASPTIDIPSTCALLISILQDSDEFIHLNAIKSLSTLADKHSITVTKLLVERYVDSEESLTLDQRLRLGEALLQIVQRLGEALVGEAANSLSDACLAVAGRRARKPKAADERAKRIQTEDAKLREAEDAWGGKVPEISDQDERDESREGLAAILSGWEGRAGSEEDLRIRTSALSVLGIAIETNISGLSATRLSATVDLALSVLTTERGDTEAILRRAAVLILLRLVRAVDAARKRGLKLGYGLWTENLKDFIRVLTYVHVVDGDAMVREHASAIRAELETAQYRSLLAELAPQEAAEGEEAVVGERLLDQPLLPMEHVGLRSMIQEIE
ncbi:MAG: hypothetical protein M1832_003665 [Thelocarpon impressellum]|nr:MAG: hypothetical protein M1832_003665 [Thelocarpon impressellum]